MIDSHCHLDHYEVEDDRAGVLSAAEAAGLSAVITISTHLSRAPVLRAITESSRASRVRVWRTVGVHPCHVAEEALATADALLALADVPDVVGIGESGLDHAVAPPGTEEAQERSFRAHIAAARRSGLPLVVHARAADEAVAATLEHEHATAGAFPFVLHCFSSGRALAERAVALGGYVSFSGILTFPKSDALRAIAREVPADRLLVETDAPYLSPVPFRGRRNEPARVIHTADVLAAVRGLDRAAIETLTDANAARLFRRIAA